MSTALSGMVGKWWWRTNLNILPYDDRLGWLQAITQDDPYKRTAADVAAIVVIVVVVAVTDVRIVDTKKIMSYIIKTLLTTLENTQTRWYARGKFNVLASRVSLITINNVHFPKAEDGECFKKQVTPKNREEAAEIN